MGLFTKVLNSVYQFELDLGEWRNQAVAIKQLLNEELLSGKERDDLIRESQVLWYLSFDSPLT